MIPEPAPTCTVLVELPPPPVKPFPAPTFETPIEALNCEPFHERFPPAIPAPFKVKVVPLRFKPTPAEYVVFVSVVEYPALAWFPHP